MGKKLLLSLVIFTVLFSPAIVAGEVYSRGWSTPQTIVSHPYLDEVFPSITAGSNGSWHVVYRRSWYETEGIYNNYLKYLNSNSESYILIQAVGDFVSFGEPSIDMGPDGRIHVVYPRESADELSLKYMYKEGDKLKLLIIPINWQGSYAGFKTKAEDISKYYLERIPLIDCPEQFEALISEEEDYGPSWVGWNCLDYGIIPPKCDRNHTLQIIGTCAAQFKAKTGQNYDRVAGITDRDICGGIAGWTHLWRREVIAEANISGDMTHELGHSFGLRDEYCDCSPVLQDSNPFNDYLASYCGPTAPYNPLRPELGCNPSTCCWGYGTGRYDPACGWCHGNYDRMRSQGIGFQRSTMSNKILYGETGHYDINGYSHLQTISQLQCDTSQISTLASISTTSSPGTVSVYADPLLTVNLIVFDDDTVLSEETDVSFGYTPIIYPEPGNYSLIILDQYNNTLYSRNMSLDFILFSDPPTFVNYSYVYDAIPFDNSMDKLELYHGNNLIFSQSLDFCDYNATCDKNENYYSCPQDCLSYEEDGICNKASDGRCDPDCLPHIDSDFPMGDVNIDFVINIFDLAAVGLCYGCIEGQACWSSCEKTDVTGDGLINIFDLATVGLNYGRSCE